MHPRHLSLKQNALVLPLPRLHWKSVWILSECAGKGVFWDSCPEPQGYRLGEGVERLVHPKVFRNCPPMTLPPFAFSGP